MQRNQVMRIQTLHNTRILSVFSLLKHVGFALLLFGGSSVAQPLDVLWEREGLAFNSAYSWVFALGDQNGDGYADWGVGATSSDNQAQSYIELFYGGELPSQQPYRIFEPIADSMAWVWRGVSLGDVNGDSIQDFGFKHTVTPGHERYAIYLGGGDPERAPDYILDFGPTPLNRHLEGIGDFNGDGFNDVLNYTLDGETTAHYIYFGSPEFDLVPDWQVSNTSGQSHLPRSWGDLNSDGYVDLLNIDRNIEQLHAFWGSANPDTVRQMLSPRPGFFSSLRDSRCNRRRGSGNCGHGPNHFTGAIPTCSMVWRR